MGRLAQTEGLTDVQQEIVKTVRGFVDKEILPNVAAARARRHLPDRHRRGHEGDGPVRPDDPGGARRAGGVAADLRAGRRGDRPRLDERQRHHQHALHRRLPAPAARHRRAEEGVPAADGHRRRARLVLDVRAGAAGRTSAPSPPRRSATATTTSSPVRRCGSPTAVRRTCWRCWSAPTGSGRGREAAPADDDLPGGEGARLRRGRAGADHPREDREDGLQGRRLHRGRLRRLPGAGRPDPRRRAGQGLLPDDGRRRGRPGQRRRPRLRGRPAGLRAGHPLLPAARDVRQADRPAPGGACSGWPRWRPRSRRRTR